MRQLLKFLALSAALLTIAACGGGGGGSSGSSGSVAPLAQVATVGIALTDAPSPEYDQVLATVTSVQLLGNGAPVTVFSGAETIDLLRLADYSELFAVSDQVPAGTYNKIRLMLSNLELVTLNPDGTVDKSITAKLVANGKIDLNPRGPFVVAGGSTLVITLDFDVKKSLKIKETGHGQVIVRPVIFVDIANGQPAPGLTRIHGLVTAINTDGSLRLCQTALVSSAFDDNRHGGSDRCVRVSTDGNTGVFGPNGLPEQLADLTVGEEATVVGRLRPLDDANDHDDDNDGINDEDDDNDGRGDHRVADRNHDGEANERFGLDAYIIEEGLLGTFKRIAGTVTLPVDSATDRFEFDVAPGQGLIVDGAIAAQLYPKSRIFSAAGVELTRDSLDTGVQAIADSVLAISNGEADVLRTALVTVDDVTVGETAVSGSVLSVNGNSLRMSTATGDRCVQAETADIFLIDESHGSLESTRGSLADLQSGQHINVFGTEGIGGCVIADTILAQVD